MMMLSRMQYDIVHGSAQAIETLLGGLQCEDELFASANTLAHVEAHLLVIAQTLAHLPLVLRDRLTRIDCWMGWQALRLSLEKDVLPRHEEVWYGLSALTPATLDLIDELRRREPVWFEIAY